MFIFLTKRLFLVTASYLSLSYQAGCEAPAVNKSQTLTETYLISDKKQTLKKKSFYLMYLYDSLCLKKMDYFTVEYPTKKREFCTDATRDTMVIYTYDSLYKIRLQELKRFSYIVPKAEKRSRVFVLDKNFSLDSLLIPKEFFNMFHYWTAGLTIREFIYNKRKYLLLSTVNMRVSTSRPDFVVLLFDVSNEKNVKLLIASEQAAEFGECFCDVNQDGHLDYLVYHNRTQTVDTLKLYTHNTASNQFDLVRDKYIVLKSDSVRAKYNIVKKEWF